MIGIVDVVKAMIGSVGATKAMIGSMGVTKAMIGSMGVTKAMIEIVDVIMAMVEIKAIIEIVDTTSLEGQTEIRRRIEILRKARKRPQIEIVVATKRRLV